MTQSNPGFVRSVRSKRLLLFACLVASLILFAADRSQASTPTKVQSLIQTAHRLMGVPYQRGGTSPTKGFDCSGFVNFVLAQHGIDVGRSSPEQFKNGQKILRQDLKPGDLVFFSSSRKKNRVTHVGLYLGDGRFIHAASRHHRIQINALSEDYWARHYYGARRIGALAATQG